MSISNIVITVAVVVWLIVRQLQVRPVKENRPYRIALVLGVIGVIEISNYVGGKHLPAVAYVILVLSLAVGAVFGFLRAQVTAVWRGDDGVLVRQGNAVTVVLWIVGLALHIGIDLVLRRTTTAADQLGSVSLLLYLAVTVAAQRWVVTGKAARLTPAAP
ncbi:MAG: hypothetical protein QOI75_1937 [Pseudonocardiales bacterium]|nr:hypothetical protein [Pseudonocardiales bacterium]